MSSVPHLSLSLFTLTADSARLPLSLSVGSSGPGLPVTLPWPPCDGLVLGLQKPDERR